MVIAAVLLAAGDAVIDGVPLALLLCGDDTTLVEYQVAQLQAAGVEVVEVVLGHDAERIIPLVSANDVEPIVDPRWQTGESSWLRVGASAVPRNTEAAVIAHVNEPRSAATYRTLLEAHTRGGAAITRASFAGTPGAPLVIDAATLAAVRNVSDGSGLDAIIVHAGAAVATVEIDVSEFVTIETAADYNNAMSLLR